MRHAPFACLPPVLLCHGRFHPQLSYCVVQFLNKSPELIAPTIKYLSRYWPKTHAQKQVYMLNEMESIVSIIEYEDVQANTLPIFKLLSKCVCNPHFMVSERALSIWLSQDVLHDALKEDMDLYYPMIAEPIYRNGKRHWSGVVHDTNDRALEALRSLDPDLFDLHCTSAVGSAEDEQHEIMTTRGEKWAKIEAMARANALVSCSRGRRSVCAEACRLRARPCAFRGSERSLRSRS